MSLPVKQMSDCSLTPKCNLAAILWQGQVEYMMMMHYYQYEQLVFI